MAVLEEGDLWLTNDDSGGYRRPVAITNDGSGRDRRPRLTNDGSGRGRAW